MGNTGDMKKALNGDTQGTSDTIRVRGPLMTSSGPHWRATKGTLNDSDTSCYTVASKKAKRANAIILGLAVFMVVAAGVSMHRIPLCYVLMQISIIGFSLSLKRTVSASILPLLLSFLPNCLSTSMRGMELRTKSCTRANNQSAECNAWR